MTKKNVSRRKVSRSRRTLLPLGAVIAILSLSCGTPNHEDEPLETVDVEPRLELDITDDRQAPEQQSGLVGSLPSDFPTGLPLVLPASLVDFGESSGGLTVTLLTPRPMPEVRRELLDQSREAGWSVAPGEGGSYELRRAGRRVKLEIGDGSPGTSYRYIY